MTAFTVIKRDARGNELLSYQGALLEIGADFVCIEAKFALPDRDLGYVALRRGDVWREWFYRERWYNIFRVQDGARGRLKGWYCNITRPAQFGTDWVAADDLCLDVFVYPDGRTLILDEAEFAALALPDTERAAARRAVQQIQQLVRNRQAPFAEIARQTEKTN